MIFTVAYAKNDSLLPRKPVEPPDRPPDDHAPEYSVAMRDEPLPKHAMSEQAHLAKCADHAAILSADRKRPQDSRSTGRTRRDELYWKCCGPPRARSSIGPSFDVQGSPSIGSSTARTPFADSMRENPSPPVLPRTAGSTVGLSSRDC